MLHTGFARRRSSQSADQTTVTTVGPTITDASGRVWAISSTGAATLGGNTIAGTSNVIELAYVSGVVWMQTSADNLYQNPTHAGLVVGTPGTFPTGVIYNVQNGMSSQVIGSGIDGTNNIAYWDVRFFGTASNTLFGLYLQNPAVPATQSTVYNQSIYISGLAGNYAALTYVDLVIDSWSSVPAYIATFEHSFIGPITSTLTQYTGSATSDAGTAGITPEIILGMTTGVAYDFTLRFGGEQLNTPALVNMWSPFSVSGGVASIGTETSASPLSGGTSGSPFGTTPPVGAIAIAVGASVQSAINAHANGTAFTLAAGTWTNQTFTPKPGNQFWGDPAGGTIFDGSSTTSTIYGSDGSQVLTGVLLKYMTFQHYGISSSENGTGVFHGVNGWTFDQCVFQDNANDGVVGYSASSATLGWLEIYGGKFLRHGHSGIQVGANQGAGGQMTHLVVRGVEIAFSNQRGDNQDNDVGGTKFTVADGAQILNNYVHDNACDGLWFDVSCTNCLIEGNTVINNAYWGIHYETSDGGTIRYNVCNDNGQGPSPGVGGGIFVSSSSSTQVYGNNIRATGRGNAIIMQADARGDTHGMANDTNHNNTVTFKNAPTGTGTLTGMRNYANASTTGTSINTNFYYTETSGSGNAHWMFSNDGVGFAFATYRTNTGQDAAATIQVGDASVAGVTHNNASGSGWTG